ncbi:MAG TPA: hypothetical protein VKV28_10435 [Candidatus Binataceae bacterium]|nr:hypothetical protein [Candidatus Binataceae bacterium]
MRKTTGGIAFLALAVTLGWPALTRAQENLLLNPDLSQGSGNSPTDWVGQSWLQGQPNSKYQGTLQWLSQSQPAELEVSNSAPDDARWVQTLQLDAGLYHLTAEIKTDNVGKGAVGANISVLEGWFLSQSLTGTNDWQPVGFYLNVPPGGANVTFACRLGFYSNLNTGTAYCRNMSVLPATASPDGSEPVYQFPAVP